MSTFGAGSNDLASLEAARASTWANYQALVCKPGWEEESKRAAATAARAQYQLDKAKGYLR